VACRRSGSNPWPAAFRLRLSERVVLCLPARVVGTALGIISFGWLNGTLFRRVMLAALQPLNHSVDARTLSDGERRRMALARVGRRRAGVDPGNRSSLRPDRHYPSHDARLPTQPIDWCGCRVIAVPAEGMMRQTR
jgi:hypothetical protein